MKTITGFSPKDNIPNFTCAGIENTRVFDEIADFYDSTRGEAKKEEVEAIINALKGLRSVLEIGVGTGRISVHIQNAGFEVTGIDTSVKMMEKAREKGLKNLVVGDARNLPFLDKNFDATILVHVFHLLGDRMKAMAEAARVTEHLILSLVREGESTNMGVSAEAGSIRDKYRKLREEYGYPLDMEIKRTRVPDNVILNEIPPTKKIEVGKFTHIRRTEEMLEHFRRSSRFLIISRGVPEKIHERIMDSLKEYVENSGIKPVQVTSTEYLYLWKPEDVMAIIQDAGSHYL